MKTGKFFPWILAGILAAATGSLLFLKPGGETGSPSTVAEPALPHLGMAEAGSTAKLMPAAETEELVESHAEAGVTSRPPAPGLDSPPSGARAVARVTNGTAIQTLRPDQLGQFPRVYIQPGQILPVSVSFPGGQPGDPVTVRVEDGGRLDDGAPGKAGKLDADKAINFAFQANTEMGSYRVVVCKGVEERVLDFWAGEELPAANR